MLSQIQTLIVELVNQPFALAIFICACVFAYLFWKNEDLDWTDMITNKGSRTVSLTKFLQLVGGLTGTWIMIKLTIQDKLTSDLFWIYLTYVGAIEGWSKFISAKYGVNNNPGTTTATQTQTSTFAPAPSIPEQLPSEQSPKADSSVVTTTTTVTDAIKP